MNKKMGYVLIILGILSVAAGIYLLLNKKVPVAEVIAANPIQQAPPEALNKQDKDSINKAKGDEFEKYIVQKFNPKVFTIKEWRSDKIVKGTYAESNKYPDFEIAFSGNSKNEENRFAIECKWRNKFYNNEVQWAEDYQINNYRDYAKRLDIPVFIALGIGGDPSKPAELYIVPLKVLQSGFVFSAQLQPYRKYNIEKGFVWNEDKAGIE